MTTIRPIVTRVLPEWVDHYGHMNLAYYLVAFDMGTDALWPRLNLGVDFRARGLGTFCAESWQAYTREVTLGAPLACEAELLEFDAKRLLCRLVMFHAEEGWEVAQNELLYLCVDLGQRRVTHWPEDVLERCRALATGGRARRLTLARRD